MTSAAGHPVPSACVTEKSGRPCAMLRLAMPRHRFHMRPRAAIAAPRPDQQQGGPSVCCRATYGHMQEPVDRRNSSGRPLLLADLPKCLHHRTAARRTRRGGLCDTAPSRCWSETLDATHLRLMQSTSSPRLLPGVEPRIAPGGPRVPHPQFNVSRSSGRWGDPEECGRTRAERASPACSIAPPR